jgi:hypothetical protein
MILVALPPVITDLLLLLSYSISCWGGEILEWLGARQQSAAKRGKGLASEILGQGVTPARSRGGILRRSAPRCFAGGDQGEVLLGMKSCWEEDAAGEARSWDGDLGVSNNACTGL